jgi:hypothetical protein
MRTLAGEPCPAILHASASFRMAEQALVQAACLTISEAAPATIQGVRGAERWVSG